MPSPSQHPHFPEQWIIITGKQIAYNVNIYIYTFLHTCSKLSGIWEDIEQFINTIESRLTLNRLSVLAGILINDEISAIVNVVISITRFEIWKKRNVYRYENILIDSRITVTKIRYEIKCHFRILANKLYSKYVKNVLNNCNRKYNDSLMSWDYTMSFLH